MNQKHLKARRAGHTPNRNDAEMKTEPNVMQVKIDRETTKNDKNNAGNMGKHHSKCDIRTDMSSVRLTMQSLWETRILPENVQKEAKGSKQTTTTAIHYEMGQRGRKC